MTIIDKHNIEKSLSIELIKSGVSPDSLRTISFQYEDDLEKGFGSDMQKRFPNGRWVTMSGARVFIDGNNEIVAGLDKMNKKIDDSHKNKVNQLLNKYKSKYDAFMGIIDGDITEEEYDTFSKEFDKIELSNMQKTFSIDNIEIKPAPNSKLYKHLHKFEDDIINETDNSFEKCGAFNDSGEKVFEKAGEKTQIGFNFFEMQKIEGAIFTHNHPNGSCFSLADLEMAMETNQKEMRACSPNSVYGKGAYVIKLKLDRFPLALKRKLPEFYNEVHEKVKHQLNKVVDTIPKADVDKAIDYANKFYSIETMRLVADKFKGVFDFYFEKR